MYPRSWWTLRARLKNDEYTLYTNSTPKSPKISYIVQKKKEKKKQKQETKTCDKSVNETMNFSFKNTNFFGGALNQVTVRWKSHLSKQKCVLCNLKRPLGRKYHTFAHLTIHLNYKLLRIRIKTRDCYCYNFIHDCNLPTYAFTFSRYKYLGKQGYI